MLRWAALLHDIGKPATRRHEADGGVSFHHHEVVGAKMVRKRMRTLKYSKQMVDDVSQLVYLHLRFHGYGEGRWTDSAVRRYVADAGPLLPLAAQAGARRLHDLQQAPRGQAAGQLRQPRGADRRAGRQGGPGARATDLDGNAIMEIPASRPARRSVRPGTTLKELRLDRGPLSREEATAELVAWWSERETD